MLTTSKLSHQKSSETVRKKLILPTGVEQDEVKFHSKCAARLEGLDGSLYRRVNYIYFTAVSQFLDHQTLQGFTDHGKRHLHAVLKYLDKILFGISPSSEPSKGEYFLVLVSAMLHDIGQLCQDLIHNDPLETYKIHAMKSRQLINENADKFGLSQDEAKVIGEICYSHCISDYRAQYRDEWSIESIGSYRTHLAMALLRMADLLDLTYSRAPAFVFKLKNLTYLSKKHWERHQIIQDIQFDRNSWTIAILAQPKSIKQVDDILEFHQWLNEEMAYIKSDLKAIDTHYSKIDLIIDSSLYCHNVSPTPKSNPFPGLAAFDQSTEGIFFGRDWEIPRAIKKIQSCQFSALVGESGVGKSSLVDAAIIPQLQLMGMVSARYRFESPIRETMHRALCKALQLLPSSNLREVRDKLLSLSQRNRIFCLYIDQFEEYFTRPFQKVEKKQGLDLLADLLSKCSNFKIMATIREEFVFKLLELGPEISISFSIDNFMWVGKLSPEKAKDAIVKPMQVFRNLTWSPVLVNKILEDLYDPKSGIYPPYLQLVCKRLVDAEFERINSVVSETSGARFQIGVELYRNLGKANRIINRYFQSILDGFSVEERDVVDAILTEMISDYNTRIPVGHAKVAQMNAGRIDIKSTMGQLIDSRVIKNTSYGYELEHDILARRLLEIIRSSIKASSKIRIAADYIKKNKNRRISLKKLCKITGLSRIQLERRFRRELKSTPKKYIKEMRIKEAYFLILNTSDSINSIARKCGFSSPSYFSKEFKKLDKKGMTPIQYRQSVQKSTDT